MKLSICTISFRHHLQSIDQIAHWAKTHQFQGIELWGIHAKNMADQPHYGKDWLNTYGLETSMLSDYLPLEASIPHLVNETMKLSSLAKHWGTNKIRTFVGKKGSHQTSYREKQQLIVKLRMVCDYLYSQEQFLLVETHPNTLTDSLTSTIELLKESNHPALRINFDVLHIWESGVDPIKAVKDLQPFVSHFHFKNISSNKYLPVFAPENVYAASGSREGMVSLFDGEVNYHKFLVEMIPKMDIHASLEWFGSNVLDILAKDSKELRKVLELVQISS
ncbi:sugar phosphate isomerase/epimerase family protein [Metabacillus litoralis]|uniref:sugar phosphate isomerase/epimerase family protein n=1 Tax=Metabacillus litoralis TaxID=152268 RepID=UPI001CFE32B7|nr:sugar phosphate isomerase/epimerase [Metabacillus litoralis]